LVEEGKTGLLVPCKDPVAMAGAIHSYLSNPKLLSIHGQAGRKRAEECFSIERMVQSYVQVYDRVLSRTMGSRKFKA